MDLWSNFFTAIAGAAAALEGLIFVGVSIGLKRILSIPKLPGRALGALLLLLNVLVVSALCLVPGQSAVLTGAELYCTGFITWIITLKLDIGAWRQTQAEYKKHYLLNILLTQLAVLPYLIAGIMMLAGGGFTGIYWLVPGILFSLIKSIIDAWVLLVEIHR